MKPNPTRILQRLLILGAAWLLTPSAMAFQAGWRQMNVAGPTPAAAATTVALYYPTQAPARSMAMGPFTVNVAIHGAPEPTVKGLIVLSHGTGGSELGHTSLAEALARVLGHSAGGYTVLALAGGQADLSRMATHCQARRADDPIFCGTRDAPPAQAPSSAESVADSRVRAVVALAPLGVMFTAASLAKVQVPVVIYEAQADRWLVPRFHAAWIAQNLPGAELRRIPNAWHFAFMDTPGTAINTEDGDIRADPPGFERAAFLKQLATELPAFFDQALR